MTICLAPGSCLCCDVTYDTSIKMPGTGQRAGFLWVVAFDSSRQ
jgi:hypothetical protein